MMRLVLNYRPHNYMALFHAGMSECITGEKELARTHLERFLEVYKRKDYWQRRAARALKSLEPESCDGMH